MESNSADWEQGAEVKKKRNLWKSEFIRRWGYSWLYGMAKGIAHKGNYNSITILKMNADQKIHVTHWNDWICATRNITAVYEYDEHSSYATAYYVAQNFGYLLHGTRSLHCQYDTHNFCLLLYATYSYLSVYIVDDPLTWSTLTSNLKKLTLDLGHCGCSC